MSPTEATQKWVNDVVVGLGLCPFASRPLRENRVGYRALPGTDFDQLMRAWLEQLSLFVEQPPAEVSTTIIIFPEGLADFEDFLDFIEAGQELISRAGLASSVQLAHFHPHYQFADTEPEDPANRTNRAPYPSVQLLRVEEVAKAIEHYPDVAGIPERNIALLRELYQK